MSDAPSKRKRNGVKKAHMEERVLAEAARLFAEKGVEGTSLTDIANALGMTRGAIYYYFTNKEALLETLVAGLAETAVQEIEIWRRTVAGSPTERLKSFMQQRLRSILGRGTKFRILITAERALPPELLRRHVSAMRQVFEEYVAIIREGIVAGEFRQTDERIAAFALIGIVNWTAWWFNPEKNRDLETIVEQLSEMTVRALVRPDALDQAPPTIGSLFGIVRSEIDYLELFVSNKLKEKDVRAAGRLKLRGDTDK
ncbi:MAG: TetR family transcriptional regulator [Rhodospirillaceae bacterium]|nr:TetR family transcriptional regulator [Rhodospirillaceae bacterium]